jgi:hypothetical protein
VISNEVLTTLITATGAVLVAYITYRVKNSKPKTDRIDTAFDMYEKIIKRQDYENQELRNENAMLRQQLKERG